MSVADKRFSDQQVRGNNELLHLAWQYARDYCGDWDPMVAAHDLAMTRHHTGDLPVAIARFVLNVMRADPAAQHRLPQEMQPDARVIKLDDFRRDPESHPHQNWGSVYADEINQVPLRPRFGFPRVVSLRWHRRYALSTHPYAKVAHIIRTVPPMDKRGDTRYGRTNIEWVPVTRSFEVNIKAWCSTNWTSRRYTQRNGKEVPYAERIDALGVILTNDTQGRPICSSCAFHESRYFERQESKS